MAVLFYRDSIVPQIYRLNEKPEKFSNYKQLERYIKKYYGAYEEGDKIEIIPNGFCIDGVYTDINEKYPCCVLVDSQCCGYLNKAFPVKISASEEDKLNKLLKDCKKTRLTINIYSILTKKTVKIELLIFFV